MKHLIGFKNTSFPKLEWQNSEGVKTFCLNAFGTLFNMEDKSKQIYQITDKLDVREVQKQVYYPSYYLATEFVKRTFNFNELCSIWNIPFPFHISLPKKWTDILIPLQLVFVSLTWLYKM